MKLELFNIYCHEHCIGFNLINFNNLTLFGICYYPSRNNDKPDLCIDIFNIFFTWFIGKNRVKKFQFLYYKLRR